jgi:hypothetical protein
MNAHALEPTVIPVAHRRRRSMIGGLESALVELDRLEDSRAARVVRAGIRHFNSLGLSAELDRDLDALRVLNSNIIQTQPGSWYPVLPLIQPEADPEDAWWLRVWDPDESAAGIDAATVACYGQRLMRFSGNESMLGRLATLDAFYGHRPRPRPAERMIISGPAAELAASLVDCAVSFAASGWIRTDHRGNGFIQVICDVSRTLASSVWGSLDLPYRGDMAFVTRKLVGMVKRYGFEMSLPRVDWWGGVLGDLPDTELMWSSAADIRRRIEARAATGFPPAPVTP